MNALLASPPRLLALMARAGPRIGGVSPFGINLALAVVAVAGGLLLPRLFGAVPGRLLAMQFVVIHSIAILYVFIAIHRHDVLNGRGGRAAGWAIDALIVCYALVSLAVGGLFGPVEFVVLAGGTFLGAWRGAHGLREQVQMGVRWAVALVALVVATRLLARLPGDVGLWTAAPERASLAAGVYFGVLAVLEKTSFYRLATERGLAIWERLLR